MAAQGDRGVPLSTLCPKYLHANSTSHTWPFSAIAELIDNAYDPDVNAKQFWIDKIVVKKQDCLSFMDNGYGLDKDKIHKMLSFGYSDKTPVKGVKPIGMYGNGFKSGSMRLGRDAIVFSKSKSVSCVGMLSQTYLEEIGANQIIVPIVCFERKEKKKFSVREEHKASLQDILRYSPFNKPEEIQAEIDGISSKTGTRIIIWNLRSTSSKPSEFDFERDRYDIRIPSEFDETMKDAAPKPGPSQVTKSNIPESVSSLRAYCSILYLKPRMQIIVRGQKVKSQLIAKTLAFVRKDHYKPTFLPKRIPITFGYNTRSKDQYGIMLYHKNRLIKAYERVGCQLKANNKGVGVIGIIECFFLEPTHNKQSFDETDKYRKTMNSVGTKLEEYWNEINYKKKQENPNSTTPMEDTTKRPDQNWVMCDECLHWRKLPDGIDTDKLPDKWSCHLNPDPQFRSCQAEQEHVDSDDDLQPSYRKTYKLKEREDMRIQEQKAEEARLADLAKQKKAQIQAVTSPSTHTTPTSRFNNMLPPGGAVSALSIPLRSSPLSQAACSPSSGSDLPYISGVFSLANLPLSRGKRTQPASPQITSKRPRQNGFHQGKLDPSTSVNVSPLSSPPFLNENDEDTDDDDDDICILETVSTPKPTNLSVDLTKVKTEVEQSDADVGMLMECSDDAALDNGPDINAAGTSSSASAAVGTSTSTGVSTSTTQTDVPKVKKEEEDQIPTERVRLSTSNITKPSGVCSVEQSVSKEARSGDAHCENQGELTLQNGVTHHEDSEEEAGPSWAQKDSPHPHPSVIEIQGQQDQLLELMQEIAQQRDSFKEQVHSLTCQLHDTQSRLQELSSVMKESSNQASQTEESEVKDYKGLFEKAKQKVEELIKEKVSLEATKPSTAQCEEKDFDEIAMQVDCLMRQLDERQKEHDELRSQLTSLEEEKTNLVSKWEFRLSLQQEKDNAQESRTTPHRASDSTVQTDPEEAGEASTSGTQSSSETFRSLIELRHNVGRLLLSYVPLELDQVNYECNVIDEILEQVLSSGVSVAPRDGATNE
ncbi:MORC family CW-type zinc finger protein 3a isoform X1 [Pseudochaenichthys georgianus]|uniref:MORC family CW-type zinc finger protein 3a isoform X1 n=1 Tax=Pseudochaenichthys georgianus TaxID=52239 RepID=UPI00146E3FC9|nr:MORC family CW-type zinc finger protein 3a isoform X1 [Pseudochaenichthys georgianus]